jgi:uroporphyrinogen-III synthase
MNARGPLAGIGVLVTRPARQAGAFAEKIAALGGEPVVVPGIAILPPDDPLPLQRAHAALPSYAAAIFVSPSAVEYGAPAPQSWPADLMAFAPGAGTAEALAAVGIVNVRIPETTFDSEGLLALPELQQLGGKRVLILRGQDGRELLGDTLAARGAQVDRVACYVRAKPTGATSALARVFTHHAVRAVTITSSEALANLWEQADGATRDAWRACPTFVPHPRIASAARELGLHAVITGPGDAGLIAGLLEWSGAFQR